MKKKKTKKVKKEKVDSIILQSIGKVKIKKHTLKGRLNHA